MTYAPNSHASCVTIVPTAPAAPCASNALLAGVATALGFGTTRLSVGQRVFGLTDWHRDGTLAEYVAVEACNLAPLPRAVDFTAGASLPISGRMNLNDDVVYRCRRPGPLHQRHPGRSRSLVGHDDRFHGYCLPGHLTLGCLGGRVSLTDERG
jgi:hypothetical protein